MEDAESAVLDAARKWIAAKEAILAADEAREGDRIATESAQELTFSPTVTVIGDSEIATSS